MASEESFEKSFTYRRKRLYPHIFDDEAGERFKYWFDKSGLNYTDLGKLLGVSRGTAAKRIKDPGTLSVEEISNLSDALGDEKFTDLLFGNGTFEFVQEHDYRESVIEDIYKSLQYLPVDYLEIIRDGVAGIVEANTTPEGRARIDRMNERLEDIENEE